MSGELHCQVEQHCQKEQHPADSSNSLERNTVEKGNSAFSNKSIHEKLYKKAIIVQIFKEYIPHGAGAIIALSDTVTFI
jgi:hypothetical protein